MTMNVIPLALLLITPFDRAIFRGESCLSTSYYGTYRDGSTYQAVYAPEHACMDNWLSDFAAESATISGAFQPVQQLVWVEEESVDETLKSQAVSLDAGLDSFLERLSLSPYRTLDQALEDHEQDVLVYGKEEQHYELFYRSPHAALLSVSHDKARIIDTLLPRFWRSIILPTSPVDYIPIPLYATQRIRDVITGVKFDPVVASLVNSLSVTQMKNDIRFLTGEDGKSGIVSRHSFAEGSRIAASWLKHQIEDTGAVCELKPFLSGFAPNVVCRYEATVNTSETVLISAHYDSRGSFGSTRAPGGDDDGSGTTGILSIARAIGAKGIKFRANVELVLFAGEEQGLLGSRAYSRELKAAGSNLTLVIQADMTAYHALDEPAQLGLPKTIGSPEAGDLVSAIAGIYSPELVVGYTSVCCSDHQSFHQQGFPATQVFERVGPIVDPMYHNSGDLSGREGYDFEQLKAIAKVQFATVLHVTGFDITK
ncbi:Zn-dependent exopeptidase [Guyanagaster necrorhizus]|uniref:Peptide hydrolase n=1 Tax=Guyanagaster necrorhizus TaxID=856835 RepID=A0A9P7VW69_9AGAR|nr:Zn-dependent exopeptidase [Guyanagaster necrorhizus MCA 3950]KAG7447570.1 Zn-dependent exopeptidase [Guyanagaster necrorhizus MCA 3950]